MNKITFCINTSRNERPYLELLLASMLNGINTSLHDLLIFVDSDNQDTFSMLLSQKELFPNMTVVRNKSSTPVGYAGNINWLFQHSKTEYVVYIQSDMVLGLNFDEEISRFLDDNTVVSGLRVEPPLHCQYDNPITYVRNFGLTPDEFDYDSFIRFSESIKNPNKLTKHYFAPFAINKNIWNKLGGHDVSFLKSREDSDIAYRLCLNKMNLIQSWSACCYHFSCISSRMPGWWLPENREKDITRQQKDQIELERFIKKWGRFRHPCSYEEVKQDVIDNPKILDNIICKNPEMNYDLEII